MNKKFKIRLFLFFFIIIFGILLYFLKPAKKNLTSKLFIINDTTNISKIIITQDTLKVILNRNKKSKKWTIDNKYPANNKAVKKLYQTLTEVKISKPVLNSRRDSLIKNIKTKGKKIEIFDYNNELLREIRIGTFVKQLDGTYMYNRKKNSIFIVNIPGLENNLNYRYNINPVYWLNPEIFSYKPNEIKEITLNYPNALSESFKLTISEDTANLINLSNNQYVKEINLTKVGSYLSYFMNVKFTSESSNSDILKNELLQKIPYAEITVIDINREKKNVKLFKIKNNKTNKYNMNKLYALVNNQDLVVVKYVNFDLILKDINYFVN